MPQTGRLIELVTDMLGELRQIGVQLTKLEHTTDTRLTSVEDKISGLGKQQATTNLLLQQHNRDLMKLADMYDQRVVHWGDRVRIEGERGATGVVSKLWLQSFPEPGNLPQA